MRGRKLTYSGPGGCIGTTAGAGAALSDSQPNSWPGRDNRAAAADATARPAATVNTNTAARRAILFSVSDSWFSIGIHQTSV